MDIEQRRLRRRHAAAASQRPRPVMNVTPLVDVVLVLLIVFMVVIPALQQGMNLKLAGIFNVDDAEKAKAPFVLSITREHDLYFEEQRLGPEALEAELRAASRAHPGRRIIVRADKRADYTRVRDVYRIAQSVGFPGVSLRVNRQQDDDP